MSQQSPGLKVVNQTRDGIEALLAMIRGRRQDPTIAADVEACDRCEDIMTVALWAVLNVQTYYEDTDRGV
ncbi:MAG: hypothetical protein K2Y37_04545 [Pirellulales bacterium]|nr:hypothetical protein [Pirellulales bacterium]